MSKQKENSNQVFQNKNLKETEMSEEKETSRRLSRREFAKGVAVGAVGMTAAGALVGCGQEAAPAATAVPVETIKEVKPWLPEKWDFEADVVVIGDGFAGQATAIEADNAGAKVIVLEKASEDDAGGNSRVCGQGFLSPPQRIWDDYFIYLKMATTGLGFPISPDEAECDDHIRKVYLEESSKNVEWFESMGANVLAASETGFPKGSWIPFYPHFPGADALAEEEQFYLLGLGNGANWHFLQDEIKSRNGIQMFFETPAKKLVQNPVTKEVLGVVADRGGDEIYIKAKRATCVCAGGWEYNQQMVRDFQGIPVNYSLGSPYNEGETIKMSWEAGADLRNMSVRAAPTGFTAGIKPPYKGAIPLSSPSGVAGVPGAEGSEPGALIMVGANNKRWHNEFRSEVKGLAKKEVAMKEGTYPGTGQIVENGVYVRDKYPMPMHMIFDEATRLAGPLFGYMGMGWASQVEGYKPSSDNSEELEMGWIVKADTMSELASKIGRGNPDPLWGQVPLEETIERWNQFCANGEDLDYGRTVGLVPFTEGPFYAVEMFPMCLNTQGGMKRNTNSQVVDVRGKVIPRLYSAGENGDIWTWVYQCMSNVGGGCYAYGRIAGRNAAAETPWE